MFFDEKECELLLRQGIYEEIITKELREELALFHDTEFDVEIGSLDPEEARKFLASYIFTVTRKALNYVYDQGKNDKEKLLKQIKTCNQIIETLSKSVDEDEFAKLEIESYNPFIVS